MFVSRCLLVDQFSSIIAGKTSHSQGHSTIRIILEWGRFPHIFIKENTNVSKTKHISSNNEVMERRLNLAYKMKFPCYPPLPTLRNKSIGCWPSVTRFP